MKVGIYNRFWSTRGGGEKHAGALAQVLSKQHDVDLIGIEPIDFDALGDHLGLDLSGTRHVVWPDFPRQEPGEARSKQYDLFINSTFRSNLVPMATRSAYLVFFPQRLTTPLTEPLLQKGLLALGALARWGCHVQPVSGCYDPDRRGAFWTCGTATLRLQPKAFRGKRADIELLVVDGYSSARNILNVEGPGVSWHCEENRLIIESRIRPSEPVDIQLTCNTFVPRFEGLNSDNRVLGICVSPPRVRDNRHWRVPDRS